MKTAVENWRMIVNYCNALTERAVAGSRPVLKDWRNDNFVPIFSRRNGCNMQRTVE